jgi:hypothetical protein
LSPIHRPSTNPQFDISTEDIIASANNAATIIKVEVYGKHDSTQGWSDTRKGKQKADDEIPDNSWHVLDSWMFDLGSLVPLSEDVWITFSLFRYLVADFLPVGRSPNEFTIQ